ncbi:hypothetical protein MIMGU_mgv1a025114mg [Erythranthe guttata]|uniref:Germin-like protein n=1 Tax=Erythranthe guttata TaxID=4155 RepID=A0A022Q874_ERYGU|nr:hypothetical protein MIMGU_mgv1a025114mg [Erythranthe guttata]
MAVFVNGKICKDPKTVTSDDFYHSGLNKPGEIISQYGSKVSLVFIDQLAGLNTLGISIVRTIYAGFISSNPSNPGDKNRLFAKILNPGDVFVFPKGLIHFQCNLENNTTAVAIASLNSQNPGVVTLSKAVFGSDPPVIPEALAKGFQLDIEAVQQL